MIQTLNLERKLREHCSGPDVQYKYSQEFEID